VVGGPGGQGRGESPHSMQSGRRRPARMWLHLLDSNSTTGGYGLRLVEGRMP
jgi:hypothetical protein